MSRHGSCVLPDTAVLRFLSEPSNVATRLTEAIERASDPYVTVYNLPEHPGGWGFIAEHEHLFAIVDLDHMSLFEDLVSTISSPIHACMVEGTVPSFEASNVTFHASESDLLWPPSSNHTTSVDTCSPRDSPGSVPTVSIGCKLDQEWLAEQFSKIDRREDIENAEQVVIKPNLAAGDYYNTGSGVVTDRTDLIHVIEAIRQLNPDSYISIVESDSIGWNFAVEKFVNQEYEDIQEMYDRVELVDLSRSNASVVELDGARFDRLKLASVLVEADLLISLGKIKTHHFTTITGSVKNLFGCLPTAEKKLHHPYLDDALPDLTNALRPEISILDGNPGIAGDPISGSPISLDTVLVGSSPIATDAIMAMLLGHDPSEIPYLTSTESASLGSISVDDIDVRGDISARSEVSPFISSFDAAMMQIGLAFQRNGRIELGHEIGHISSASDVIGFVLGRIDRLVSGTPLEYPAKRVYRTFR